MNGLSNLKFRFIVSLYVLFIGIIVLLFLFYPTIYNRFEKQRQNQIIDQVETALNKESTFSKLSEITKDPTVELMVLEDQNLIYESLPLQGKTEDIGKFINKENLIFQKTYTYRDYEIWLAFYPEHVQSQFNILAVFVCFLIVLLIIVMTLMVYFIYHQLFHPLMTLRESIIALKKFNFDQAILITEYKEGDGLLADLSTFSKKLKKNIDQIGTKFTELELRLKEEQDLNLYKKKLINSLIHDLKTPLSIMIMTVELLMENKTIAKSVKNRLEELLKRQNVMLSNINDILKASNSQIEIIPEEKIDLVEIVRETIQSFQVLMSNKEMYGEINMPRSLKLNMSRIEAEQLLHNIVSNVINYAPKNSVFTLDIMEVQDSITITVFNQVETLDQIDFEHVFDLFYHSKAAENVFSTGLGMYTIAAIVHRNYGTCSFSPINAGVCLKIELPLVGDK